MKNHIRISFIIVTLILITVSNVSGIYITNVSIPKTYVLNENFCRPLILDCIYEFSDRDVGFVLKWFHNQRLIYQWIPPKRPYFFSTMDYGLNPVFIISNEDRQKYRALQLLPNRNLSGDWMCSVQSFYEHDVRIQRMQIVVPEKSFQIFYHEVKVYGSDIELVLIICKVKLISPEPNLKIIINEQFELISDVRIESDGNFLNKSIISRVDKSSIPNPSTIACVLEINGTNYEKRQQLVYYDKNYDKRYSVKFQRFMSDIWSRAGNMQNEKFKISLVLMVVNLMKLL